MRILILDTTFLIDVQRMIKAKGREMTKQLVMSIIKQIKEIEAIWIPRTVEQEFAIKDKEKRYKELLYSDLRKLLSRIGIRFEECPIYSKSEIKKIRSKFPNVDAGEVDAIHQALLLSSYKKYRGHSAIIISNDYGAKHACKELRIEIMSVDTSTI